MYALINLRGGRAVIDSNRVTPTHRGRSAVPSRRPVLIVGNRSSGPVASDWVRNFPSRVALVIQKRCYATEPPHSGASAEPDCLGYLKQRKFSQEDIRKIRETTDGIAFEVIPLSDKDTDDLNALKRFVTTFFVKPIQSHPDSSALGGEKVLLLNPANPEKGKPDSSFLMTFDGKQDPHLHAGPRHLDMWSFESWSVIVGGSDPDVLKAPRVNFTKIDFPAGHVSLSFRKNMLHGFSGKGIGAISTHWTDAEELEALKQKNSLQAGVDSKELMATLTQFVPQEKVSIIGDQGIPWHVISELKTTRPRDE